MKIGIESQRIFRSHKHGMDVVAVELIKQLQTLNAADEFILFARAGPDSQCIQPSDNLKIELPVGLTYGDWEQIALPHALKKIRPDFIHCTANTAPLKCPVPLVLTLHDVIFLRETTFKGTAYQNFGNLYRRLVVPYAIKNAQKIITVSEEEKKVITQTCNVDPSKLVVIHNAVDSRFNASHTAEKLQEFRRKYNLPADFILHLGNTAPKKNTAKLVEAYVEYCTRDQQAIPMVIADYPPALVRNKLAEFGEQKLMKKIFFPGYIPSQEMPLLYACAALFIYPSLQESFGLPLLEAMASGTPVITSEVPALREVGGDAAIFINPSDANSITEAIRSVLSNDDLRKRCVQDGITRARMFSWKNSAEKLMEVYKEM